MIITLCYRESAPGSDKLLPVRRAHLGELDVDPGQFVDARVHLTDVMDLRTHVAVQKLEAILHAAGLQELKHLDHFREREARNMCAASPDPPRLRR